MFRNSSLRTARAIRGASKRRLHLESNSGVGLLSKYIPGARVTAETSTAGVPIRLLASRGLNVPVFEAEKDGKSVVLPLDISSASLPAGTNAWLGDIGIQAGEREATTKALQGVWDAWRNNGLLRVSGKLESNGHGTELTGVTVIADDFALSKYPANKALGDEKRIHPLERTAAEGSLFYHKNRTGGNIACYGYGAGIAMSSMDALVAEGGTPANFLDGGGGATVANVKAAMSVIMNDPDAKVIFVNSFGGITKMDLIAEEMVKFINAWKAEGKHVPRIVARLRGTGEESAREILNKAAIPEIEYFNDLRPAAAEAVRLAGGPKSAESSSAAAAAAASVPVTFSRDGQYEQTLRNLTVKQSDPVMVLGAGKASQANNLISKNYGTNIVGTVAPRKGGQEMIGKPVFNTVKEGVAALKPRIASVFVPPFAAADAIIECIEAEIPLVVAYAEGIPTQEQLKVQRALRSQNKTRVVGANCPGVIFPHERVKLGIQPLQVHSPGCVGIATRSGTISYELAAQTTALGLGQSAVYGLGGDPFPSTRTWEALQLILEDPKAKFGVLVGEVGGQMEEEAAQVYQDYLANLKPGEVAKPIVGFVAGAATERGLMYGHAGAVWWNQNETAVAKRQVWKDAGFIMADTLGDLGPLIKETADKMGL
ncbi:hypothetical protein CspHIS471_0204250 [Cutaneotrichosporon sp. HIS471]|nr:hypothetical protein CspHIS471_0204250 [Cutaneotrichosporon sp. HIS471]